MWIGGRIWLIRILQAEERTYLKGLRILINQDLQSEEGSMKWETELASTFSGGRFQQREGALMQESIGTEDPEEERPQLESQVAR